VKLIFPETKEEFLQASLKAYFHGVNMFGGCCGTTPEFIKLLSNKLRNKPPILRKTVDRYYLSTRTKTIDINKLSKPIFIGERINPTNKKKLQEELFKYNLSSVKEEARSQVQSGASILDVNVSIHDVNEEKLLINAVNQIQEIVSVPLCIDSSNFCAMEQAVKNCTGRPIINSVNGEYERLDLILPIAKKYGTVLIALTSNDKGIPKTMEDRLDIAAKILDYSSHFGIERKNIIFDYLVLAVSSSPDQVQETLKAMKKSKILYPECKLVLGISNISFGLPSRQTINSTFLKMAISAGLDFAIVNPHENWNIDNPIARNLLNNKDKGAVKYIETFASFKECKSRTSTKKITLNQQLYYSILNGDKESVSNVLDRIIKYININDLFKVVNDNVLKALSVVGEKFASKNFFLPQIIMSAQAAQKAFVTLKSVLSNKSKEKKYMVENKIIMATVKGDMHDIGKNIVGIVLESYGFKVIDMGINVDSRSIIKKAEEINPIAIGLSALMTTTMLEMEKIIALKNANHIPTKVIVGGAALTKKFADDIGADAYAKDAIDAALCINEFVKIKNM
jgi:5-methyltetrahydrofolate--homocysteine methyltransferase